MILFIGAAQGLFMGLTLLFTKQGRKHANRFLSILLLFLSYRLITEALKSMGITGVDSSSYYFFLEYYWVCGPLLYFYVRGYVDPDFRVTFKDLIHALPLVIHLSASLFVKLQNLYWDGTQESLSYLGFQGYRLWMHTPFQLIIFSALFLFFAFRSRQRLFQYSQPASNLVQREDDRWLRLILWIYSLFSILSVAIAAIDYLFFNFAFNPFYKIPVYGSMAALTYWMGLQGFHRRKQPFLTARREMSMGSSLTEMKKLEVLLRDAMSRDKLFRNPTLSLAQLSEAVALKPYQTTQVLNRVIEKNFSDFVNEYRVSEVSRMVKDEQFAHLSLLGIAHEAGFNSKASFNRIVKKLTGKPPSALKDRDKGVQ